MKHAFSILIDYLEGRDLLAIHRRGCEDIIKKDPRQIECAGVGYIKPASTNAGNISTG
jgi:hypothetical protein